ncbi:MAG: exodeoxyribonuclease VII large subunit, partial [Gammaproteobacteria bacterium]|nr:exodeoxyribonuclease VII large subunit [Gammaproteobacteria bacterium]
MRQPPANEVISVSELNRQARSLLESGLQQVWLEAEISNLASPASGHIYFSLKDKTAQVRCAMFKGSNRQLRFKPENGMAVLVHAKVSIYEARGEYQLVADHMEEAGEGQLRRQFEELKARLDAEGLFSEEQKKTLPEIPSNIGIVTSPSGAAVRDILHILKRRFPTIPVTIYPTAVQGDAAIMQIAKAIAMADEHSDLIILARGGGSLEDLWAFNEEV